MHASKYAYKIKKKVDIKLIANTVITKGIVYQNILKEKKMQDKFVKTRIAIQAEISITRTIFPSR